MNVYILESVSLLDASVNVEVTMTEEFPAFQKDELSPEENILIKTETNSHDEVEERDTEAKVSFPCTKCKYIGETFEDLNKHTRRKHILGNVEKNSDGVFKCKTCDYVTKTRGRLYVHIQKHEGQIHRCSQCPYTSITEAYLKIHIGRSHNEQKFQCNLCEFSTQDKYRLRRHMKCRHDNVIKELKYNCDKCNYKTHSNSYLKRHKQTHDGILIYCDQCPYSTPSGHNMKYHTLRTHSDLVFSCDKCPFSCRVKVSLNKHVKRVHEKGKHVSKVLHNCDVCDKKFSTPTYLKYHKESHEGVTHHCDQCSYYNSSAHYLKYHKKRNHGCKTKII